MKLLLVEDTRAMAAVMAARLMSFGHEVRVAENGLVAIAMFAESSPDMVLMDIEMPVMNGFEATNRIRVFEAEQQRSWTPILFLTASDSSENLVTAIEAGGDDFLAKTVPEPVLRAKMKAMARIATLSQGLSLANQKLKEIASRDCLTGLYNRRYMDQRLDALWIDAVRLSQPFGLLMIDIDNFKKYNDYYGHLDGDDCLRCVSSAIARTVEQANADKWIADGFSARYGGEEFAIIIPNVSEPAFQNIATAIIDAVRNCRIPHEKNVHWGIVTVSIGGARAEVTAGRVAEMFRMADARLYVAKDDGRNRANLTE